MKLFKNHIEKSITLHIQGIRILTWFKTRDTILIILNV